MIIVAISEDKVFLSIFYRFMLRVTSTSLRVIDYNELFSKDYLISTLDACYMESQRNGSIYFIKYLIKNFLRNDMFEVNMNLINKANLVVKSKDYLNLEMELIKNDELIGIDNFTLSELWKKYIASV